MPAAFQDRQGGAGKLAFEVHGILGWSNGVFLSPEDQGGLEDGSKLGADVEIEDTGGQLDRGGHGQERVPGDGRFRDGLKKFLGSFGFLNFDEGFNHPFELILHDPFDRLPTGIRAHDLLGQDVTQEFRFIPDSHGIDHDQSLHP
jgi:hypothetical protein